MQHVSPKNELTEIGSSVLLMCRRTSPLIRWTFYPTESSTAAIVVEGCRVLKDFIGQYIVDITDLSCNLYIAAVKMNQSGTYACQDSLSTESPTTAQLIVYRKYMYVYCVMFTLVVDGISLSFTYSLQM